MKLFLKCGLKIKREINEIKSDLFESWKRLKEVQLLKNKALSEYDVNCGYDWKFYTKATHFGLMRNHVIYYIKELKEFKRATYQLELF